MSNNAGRSAKSIRNVTIGLASKIIILLLTFISRKLFISVLGNYYLGINSLFTDVLTMLNMADLGFGVAMSYSFYKPLAEKDEDKLAALVNFFGKVYKIIALAVTAIGIGLIPFLEILIRTENTIPHLRLYYVLYLTNTVCTYLCVYKSSIINADQKNYVITSFEMITTFIRVILQFGVLKIASMGYLEMLQCYVLYIVVNIICTLANNIFISIKANKLYPFVNKKIPLPKEDRDAIYSNVKSVFIYKISNMLLNSVDSMLITGILSVIMVGVYSNYGMVTLQIINLVTMCFTAVTASVGNLFATEDGEKRYKVFSALNMGNYYISAICVGGLYACLNDLEYVWLKDKYTALPQLAVIAIIMVNYTECQFKSTVAFREATGIYKKIKYSVTVAAVLNVILSYILGKGFMKYAHLFPGAGENMTDVDRMGYGLAGILFATVIVKFSTYMWYEPYVLFRDFLHKKSILYFRKRWINHICTILCVVIIHYVLKLPFFSTVSWPMLVVKAAVSVGIVTFVYFIRYIGTEEFAFVSSKLKWFKK